MTQRRTEGLNRPRFSQSETKNVRNVITPEQDGLYGCWFKKYLSSMTYYRN